MLLPKCRIAEVMTDFRCFSVLVLHYLLGVCLKCFVELRQARFVYVGRWRLAYIRTIVVIMRHTSSIAVTLVEEASTVNVASQKRSLGVCERFQGPLSLS